MANTKKVLTKEVVPYQMVPPQSLRIIWILIYSYCWHPKYSRLSLSRFITRS